MRKILNFAIIASILILGACTKYMPFEDNPSPAPTPTPSGRTMTFTASMPNQPIPRVALEEDGLNINVTWKTDDKIQLVLVQGTIKIRLTQGTVIPNASNKHIGTFNVDLPTDGYLGYDASAPFNLYGVHGGGGIDGASTLAILPSNVFAGYSDIGLSGIQSRNDVMLHFSLENIQPNATIGSVKLNHLGSIFVVHVKNFASKLNDMKGVELAGFNMNTNTEHFAYNSYYSGNTYDLETGEFTNNNFNGDNSDNFLNFNSMNKSALNSGATRVYWAWFPLIPGKQWPQLKIKVKIGSEITGTNIRKARTPEIGKTYHFYGRVDGEYPNRTANFTKSNFNTIIANGE